MSSTPWRDRLTYLAMSLVVAWHSFAMVVGPAPGNSTLVQSLRPLVQPYISLFRLDTSWNFFAPVGKHTQFRYVIEDMEVHEGCDTSVWSVSLLFVAAEALDGMVTA